MTLILQGVGYRPDVRILAPQRGLAGNHFNFAVDAHWAGLIHPFPEYLYSGIRGG